MYRRFSAVHVGLAVLVGSIICSLQDPKREAFIQARHQGETVAFASGLCAVGGPVGAVFFCSQWGIIHHIGQHYYRCRVIVPDQKHMASRLLEVAQFATEEAAILGQPIISGSACDHERTTEAVVKPHWNIPTWRSFGVGGE